MSQDAARRCIEILGTEFEKWNSVGEKLLVGRMEHNLATTIVKSYITGIAQPGRIVQDDPFQQQPDTAVDLGRVGALFNRVDSVNSTLSRMDFEMHRAKRVKMQTNAEIAQLLLGLSAIGLVQSPASFEDRSMATAVPSIREDLQRAKTQVKALTCDALNLGGQGQGLVFRLFLRLGGAISALRAPLCTLRHSIPLDLGFEPPVKRRDGCPTKARNPG